MADLPCAFCKSRKHHVENCELLRRSKGVRFDPETRQLLWSICTSHDYWSTNEHADCLVCARVVPEVRRLAWNGSAKEFWAAVSRHTTHEFTEGDVAVLQDALEQATTATAIALRVQRLQANHDALLALVRAYEREFYDPNGSIVNVDIARNKLFAAARGEHG